MDLGGCSPTACGETGARLGVRAVPQEAASLRIWAQDLESDTTERPAAELPRRSLSQPRCCCKPQSSRLSNGHAAGTGREAGEEKGADVSPNLLLDDVGDMCISGGGGV